MEFVQQPCRLLSIAWGREILGGLTETQAQLPWASQSLPHPRCPMLCFLLLRVSADLGSAIPPLTHTQLGPHRLWLAST